MSPLRWMREHGTGRRHLRHVPLRRARTVEAGKRVPPAAQAGEKLTVAAVAGAVVTLAIGFGGVEGGGGWFALAVLVALASAAFVRFLTDFRSASLASLARVVGLAVLITLPVVALAAYEDLVAPARVAFLPLALVSLVLSLAWSRALAIEGTVFASLLLVIYLGLRSRLEGAGLEGVLVCVAGGLAAALASDGVTRRNSLVRIGLVIALVQGLLAATLPMLDGGGLGDRGVATVLLLAAEGLVIGLLASALLPAIESLFSVTTNISLLELGNTNEAPLLKKLLLEAPGTFHHSYVVGLLAEAAAEEVGCDALLARVGALYHDVGKLNKVEYFAENSPEARERHRELAPEMSTLIISAHPRDGMELGRFYGLPQAVLDFMPEHHGTCLIEYFHEKARRLRGDQAVSEGRFRYPGPKPQRIETAIVMIADAAEAIARQMPDPTQGNLEEMVHRVAMKRLMDGQFAECGLTLADLDGIERACVRVLAAIHHTRPTFPKGQPHPLDLSRTTRQAAGAAARRPDAGFPLRAPGK